MLNTPPFRWCIYFLIFRYERICNIQEASMLSKDDLTVFAEDKPNYHDYTLA